MGEATCRPMWKSTKALFLCWRARKKTQQATHDYWPRKSKLNYVNITLSVPLHNTFFQLFHVRKVSPADAFRANQRDIPRMFQIIYGNEGKTSSTGLILPSTSLGQNSHSHKLLPITYRTPGTHCDLEGCRKSLWSVVQPPPALACQKCTFKIHKYHMDEECVQY